jgi:hypothetical protein
VIQEELEALYSSSSVEDIFNFYEALEDVRSLVRFSRSRPSAPIRAAVEGSREDYVFVVPTPDINCKNARNVARLFRGAIVLFVESSGRYFNYAKSINRGLAEALKFNPEWIILANDDLFEVDPIERLYQILSSERDADAVLASPGYIQGIWLHSHDTFFCTNTEFYDFVIGVFRQRLDYPRIAKINRRFGATLSVLADYPLAYESFRFYLNTSLYKWGRYRHVVARFRNFGDFCAMRPRLVRKYQMDETFINNAEDLDLSFRFKEDLVPVAVSKFRVGSGISTTLGTSKQRRLRSLLNGIYLSNKLLPRFA